MFDVLLIGFYFLMSSAQRTAYNETCNSTEECSDHRYICQLDELNVSRCLCDRFHLWHDEFGCFQVYNATLIMNMTVTVTEDSKKLLEEQITYVMKSQVAAGFFVFGMIIVGTVTVIIFCIYIHIHDRKLKTLVDTQKKTCSQRKRVERQLVTV